MKRDKKSLIITGILGIIILVITGMPIFAWTKAWFKACPAVLFWVVFAALNAIFPLSYIVPGKARGIMHTAGAALLPLEMTLYPLVIIADIVWLITKFSPLITGCIVLVLFIAACIYGYVNARNIKTKTYDIAVAKETEAKSFIMLSDLHLGFFTDKYVLKRILPEVKKIQPAFIVIAGDIFDRSCKQLHGSKFILRDLKKLSTICPVYACEGNHDNLSDEETVNSFIEQAGITLIRDGKLEKDGLTLVFRRDALTAERKSAQEILADCDKTKPVIVADHNPDEMAKLWDNGADLVLSGHIHGGLSFPGNFIVKLTNGFSYGSYSAKGHHGIVTSGMGNYGTPIRILTDNEICLINLTGGAEVIENDEPEESVETAEIAESADFTEFDVTGEFAGTQEISAEESAEESEAPVTAEDTDITESEEKTEE